MCHDSTGRKTYLINGWGSLFCCGDGEIDNYPHQGLIDWDNPEFDADERLAIDPNYWENIYVCMGCRMIAYYDELYDLDYLAFEMIQPSIPAFEKNYYNVKREITKLSRQQSAVEQFFKQVVSKELEEERWNPHRTLGKLQFDMRLRDDGIIYD